MDYTEFFPGTIKPDLLRAVNGTIDYCKKHRASIASGENVFPVRMPGNYVFSVDLDNFDLFDIYDFHPSAAFVIDSIISAYIDKAEIETGELSDHESFLRYAAARAIFDGLKAAL